jgi:hypothetical protein
MQLTVGQRLVTAAASSLFLGLSPANVRAQESLLGPGAAFISIGVARVATSELDARLAANGYPTFGQTAKSIGIGGYRILNDRFLLGAEITGVNVGEEPHNGRDVWLGGGSGTLSFGYVKDLTCRLRIYPRIGVGAGGLSMVIESPSDTLQFDDVLNSPPATPSREPVLSRDGGVLDLGVGLEFLSRGSGKGALIGLRAGYLATSFGSKNDWQFYQRTASNGPAASIAGFYARAVIGGGWSR